jgi:hypothetical protein
MMQKEDFEARLPHSVVKSPSHGLEQPSQLVRVSHEVDFGPSMLHASVREDGQYPCQGA